MVKQRRSIELRLLVAAQHGVLVAPVFQREAERRHPEERRQRRGEHQRRGSDEKHLAVARSQFPVLELVDLIETVLRPRLSLAEEAQPRAQAAQIAVPEIDRVMR